MAVSTIGLTLIARTYRSTPDTIAEKQPLIEPRSLLAYEGRVDNRSDVAFALGRPELAHASDGAVLAGAYEAWGASLSAKVLGEFAYVVFDREDAKIVAGQDSLGVRRIFYRSSCDRVWITSDLRLLFEQFPDARPSVDPEVMPEYFSCVMEPWSGRTIWRGIRELGRGCAVIMRGDVLEERAVWRPDSRRRFQFRDRRECDEAFRAVLFQGVAAALRTTGPILCDLSGGYDSSTVCAVASRLAHAGASPSGPIISWAYQSERSDESEFREAVSSGCGIESHVVEMKQHLPFRVFSDSEIPTLGFLQLSAVEEAMRGFAQARGIRTRLTGHGGDALFLKGFPPNYLGDWLRAFRFLDWARDFRAYVRSGRYSVWHLLRDCTLGSLDMQSGKARLPLPNWISPGFRRAMEETEHEFYCRRERVFESAARELVYRCTLLFVRPHGSLLPDERAPLVYRPLVELILGLDWEHLVRPDENRVVMRRALRGILPDALRTRATKEKHLAPVYAGLRANWPRISHLVTGERLAELGVVEPKLFREAVNVMRAGHPGPGRNSLVSMTALYLETWMNLKGGRRNSA
jgi:asparagine synthase (glutamine-hydrolysing)